MGRSRRAADIRISSGHGSSALPAPPFRFYPTESITRNVKTGWRPRFISSHGSLKLVQRNLRISPSGASMENKELPSNFLRDKKMVPASDPPRIEDIDRLYQFFDRRSPLYLFGSPNGAYSTGFRPITHQEFLRSNRARRRYWARSYAGWRRFTAAQPGPAHIALASLEKAGRINFMMTQNVDRLWFSLPRNSFQDQVKALNPKWAEAIESLDYDSRSDKSFGMKQRPDGDIEIDEKFWEEEFHIPNCQRCNGILKPDVVFFGDNVPKGRVDRTMEAAKECDAFLVLGSSLMTMSASGLSGKDAAAHEAGAATAIVNIGVTRADDFVPLKISAKLGEILPRLLSVGSLGVPLV
ncbi:UNVERIFIED_CONTAM: NAD-dependent protein deacylase SRT2 [Sesamum latifolium]|uniref:NAD-dependent protein deacylase SRT2 n=1 Tax=Sesamum latifolium TaxID=2727402 RepID=A0AAW2X7Q6_9LAMI